MSRRSDLALIASVAQLLTLVLIVACLSFAREVFIPLALALLLSFLLSPLVNRLQRLGTSNLLAVLATMTLTFVLLAVGLTLIGRELKNLLAEMPQYKEELVAKARSVAGLRSDMGDSLDELAEEVSEALEKPKEQDVSDGSSDTTAVPVESIATDGEPESLAANKGWDRFRQLTAGLLIGVEDQPKKKVHDGKDASSPLYVTEVQGGTPLLSWAGVVGTVLGPVGTAGLVTVFALFMLVHRQDLRDRLIDVVSYGDYITTTEALNEVARRISRYLIAQTVINTSFGVVLSIGLFFIGRWLAPDGEFPNIGLWGILATTLRFIPYVGPIVGAIFPLTISLAVFPGYSVFTAVLILIVVMELISNNVLEPWLYGTSTGMSAVAVIVAAVFWGWLWGPVGLLLSTPLTVCLVVLGRHVPHFRMFSKLLGDEVQIRVWLRFYQRILARDERSALKLLDSQYQNEHKLVDACDEVLIPTFKRLRVDFEKEELTASELVELEETIETVIEKLGWMPTHVDAPHSNDESDAIEEGTPVPSIPSSLPRVIGCPAHHASEQLILGLLALQISEECELEVVDESVLPSLTAERICALNPAAVVISVIPPGGLEQARFLCQAFRDEGYTGPILVACFGKFKHFGRIFVKLRRSGASSMTTTVQQTLFKLASILGQQTSRRNASTSGRPI